VRDALNRVEDTLRIEVEKAVQPPWRGWPLLPVAVAAAAVTLVLLIVVAASKSAWILLGAGRGLVPEEYYHVSAFLLLLGTTFGQAVGWAGGSAIGYYVMTLVGFGPTWRTVRIAMSLVYVGLAGFPLLVYEILYGKWLLDIPRVGLEEWLATNYPDAYWLLIKAHPVVDYSLIPLGVVVLGILWGLGERVQRDPILQTVLALALLGTSLAVALSLGIHSTLVHIRL
jgi:hypothetical protein